MGEEITIEDVDHALVLETCLVETVCGFSHAVQRAILRELGGSGVF